LQQLLSITDLKPENITSIGYLSGKMHGLIKARVQQYLDDAAINLKMELYPVLNTLWKQEGVTQQSLCDQLGYDRHKMSRLLDVLEESGWIQREDHPNSRREKMISLTEFSHSNKQRVLDCVNTALADALHGFTPERKKAFVEDFRQVINNLS
jgi:DNA-binding MarR family transcriptional regulator